MSRHLFSQPATCRPRVVPRFNQRAHQWPRRGHSRDGGRRRGSRKRVEVSADFPPKLESDPQRNKQTLREYLTSAAKADSSIGSDVVKSLDVIRNDDQNNGRRDRRGISKLERKRGMDQERHSRLPERFADFREGDLSATDERRGTSVERHFPP